ncbi:putative esterase [Desulfamplus magnetovallimortis]|uniref:Putative esterase n=1 Tax=Desulfamplus magnetovallimortis TaxID=1246637 RepID=A0A1W1HEE7_9BACT|nr:hotdog fold thioesterase [Desulfamplus magnetovallimortis]SLM30752.1 putative esterase [Desulfamplus magnetovallimortis]
MGHIGIEFIEKGSDFLRATLPVDQRTVQPMGILHGGASVVLAETLGSVASHLAIDDTHYAVGLEINANHIKSAREGLVTGMVTTVHLGKRTHVWDISIRNGKNQLICVSRLTMAILVVS